MAELKYINKLNSNENVYDDGNIEEKLLNHYKYGNNIDENEAFYLTTDIRNNILNWYPFDNNKNVLEIGCGCGTLTEILCEKCKNVTCVEGSSRRAEITYYRHKNKKNLEVKYDEYNFYDFENCKLLIKDHPFITFEVNSKNFKISLKILNLSEEEKSNLFSHFIKNEEKRKKLEEEKINLTNSDIKKGIIRKLFGGKNERK